MYGEVFRVVFCTNGVASIDDSTTMWVKVSDLCNTFLDLSECGSVPQCDGEDIVIITRLHKLTAFPDASNTKYVNMMPNPDRILADGEPLYTSFIDYFGDNVLGNVSKSWNKHWNIYFSHRNLPRQMLQQEFHVHFLLTSPFASVSEQYSALKEQMEYVLSTALRQPAHHLTKVNTHKTHSGLRCCHWAGCKSPHPIGC
jgi:hypothetical protein